VYNQVIVKVGIKSSIGIISSKKPKIPASFPVVPLYIYAKSNPEMGAQITSIPSPRKGTVY